MVRRVLILLSLTVLVGCTSSKRMGREYPARPGSWPIGVYASGGAPEGLMELAEIAYPPGFQIGTIETRGTLNAPWSRLINRAKDEARDMGGDAILITGGDEHYKTLTCAVYRREDGPR